MMIRSSSMTTLSSISDLKDLKALDSVETMHFGRSSSLLGSLSIPLSPRKKTWTVEAIASPCKGLVSTPRSRDQDGSCLQPKTAHRKRLSFSGGDWDFQNDLVPWPLMRRTASDTDLHRFRRISNTVRSLHHGRMEPIDREYPKPLNRITLRSSLTGNSSSRSECPGTLECWNPKRRSIKATNPCTEKADYFPGRSVMTKESFSRVGMMHSHMNLIDARPSVVAEEAELSTVSEAVSTEDYRTQESMQGPEERNPEFEACMPSDNATPSSRDPTIRERNLIKGEDDDDDHLGESDLFSFGRLSLSASGRPILCNSRGCRPVGLDDTFWGASNNNVLPMERSMDMDGMHVLGSSSSSRERGSSKLHHNYDDRTVDGTKKVGSSHKSKEDACLEADVYYQQSLLKDPGNPLLLRNYARFFHEVRHDLEKAEEYYQRAILANPVDGEVLVQYAKFIWENQKDQERAASYFDRAMKSSPDDCFVLAAYASFLWSIDSPEESQETATNHCPDMAVQNSNGFVVNPTEC